MRIVYGNLILNTETPVNELKTSVSLSKETQEQDAQKPSTVIKSVGLMQFTLNVLLLYPIYKNIDMKIQEILNTIENSTPQKIIINGKPKGKNKWILTSLNISQKEVSNSGKTIYADISLTFEEYYKSGVAKSKTNTANAPGVKSNITLTDTYNVSDPTAEEKATLKM